MGSFNLFVSNNYWLIHWLQSARETFQRPTLLNTQQSLIQYNNMGVKKSQGSVIIVTLAIDLYVSIVNAYYLGWRGK